MEIRGKAWRPGDLKRFYKADYVCPEAHDDQAAAVEAATDIVAAELMTDSGAKNDSVDIYYNIDSREYKSLINDVREKALKEGREEAWDLARRIVTTGENCYSIDEVNKAFGNMNILTTPIEEVLAKDKEYQEEKKKLHVGDEVEFINSAGTIRGYVTNIISTTFVRVLTKEYGTYTLQPEKCKKTGNTNAALIEALRAFDE